MLQETLDAAVESRRSPIVCIRKLDHPDISQVAMEGEDTISTFV